jgi:hypothetical protein
MPGPGVGRRFRLLVSYAAAVVLVAGPAAAQALRVGQGAPEVEGGPWINSAPLTMAGLRGKVVVVEFWTYG